MANITVCEINNIPDNEHYINRGIVYKYKCTYYNFTFYTTTDMKNLDGVLHVCELVKRYFRIKKQIDITVEKTAENIQNYFYDERNKFLKYSHCMKMAKFYFNNQAIIDAMIEELTDDTE